MGATIRLYRRFYQISSTGSEDTYSLFTPSEIVSTNVYLKNTSTLIENVSVQTEESTGVYYADLNAALYSFDNTYDLKWTVKYVTGGENKVLTTSFKLHPINIANSIDIEIVTEKFEIELEPNEFEVIII